MSTDTLKLLVKPGGAGMVVCISSLLARADLIEGVGGFALNLGFYADSDFMFRLALRTGFCYVNHPLVWFDRSPDENRHVGASKEWDKLEFILQESRDRLEGFLRMSDTLPVKVVKLIREHLSTVYSGLANWHLETGQYPEARQAVSKAMRLDPTFNIAVKWLLTWMSPKLALRTVRRHLEAKKGSAGIV